MSDQRPVYETRSVARKRKDAEGDDNSAATAPAPAAPSSSASATSVVTVTSDTANTAPSTAKPETIADCRTCLMRKAEVIVGSCGHACYCLRCLVDSGQWSNEGRASTCPACGAVQRAYYRGVGALHTAARVADAVCTPTGGTALFDTLNNMFATLESLRINDIAILVNSCSQLAALEIENWSPRFLPFMSVAQCEQLLQRCQTNGITALAGGHRMQHVLVSLCRHPWAVDAALGQSGVCYHGNMGDVPSLCGVMRTLKNNAEHVSGRLAYSWDQ